MVRPLPWRAQLDLGFGRGRKKAIIFDGRHAVFGRVIEGMDVVDRIGAVETGAGDRPVFDVIIKTINITKIEKS